MLHLEPLLSAEITLAPPHELGDTPQGRRRIIGITGGSFAGARLAGRVLPGGADWQVIRVDGVAYLDARYAWLNRIVCVATGERRASSVILEMYEVK